MIGRHGWMFEKLAPPRAYLLRIGVVGRRKFWERPAYSLGGVS